MAELADQVSGVIHAGDRIASARPIADFSKLPAPRKEEEAIELIRALFHWCLDAGDYSRAARLLWPSSVFTCEPRCTKMVWDALDTSSFILLVGASSQSKTYSPGVYFFLDWLRDPEYTTVKVVGPSEEHLQSNLFSHLVKLHRSATIPLPGKVGDLYIGLDLRERRSSIAGVTMPLGRKAAGRLQGTKRFNRATPHTAFGGLSRLRVLIDEIERVPAGVWSDLDNLIGNLQGASDQGLKIVGALNPQDVGGAVYQRAEPPQGWAALDPDKDERWISKRGWDVVRLDAEKSENVISGKIIFPGLQTKEGLDMLAKSSGGRRSAGYFTFGRALYPPEGLTYTVIPESYLLNARGLPIYIDPPRNAAGGDLSLEGADPAVMALGRWGLASGIDCPPSLEFPLGRKVFFMDANGKPKPRHVLCLDRLADLPNGNAVVMAEQVRVMARGSGVEPRWLCLDRTGNGAGVHDILKSMWASEVQGVNYSQGCTKEKVLEEDTETADLLYDRMASELWYSVRKWLEAGALVFSPLIDSKKLFPQLTGRQAEHGRKSKVESKPDYKSRNAGASPNEADAVTLLVHGVRMASHAKPSIVSNSVIVPIEPGRSLRDYTGITDRLDTLEAPERDGRWNDILD